MTYIIRVVPSGCQIYDEQTDTTPHMLNFSTINELRCSPPNNTQFSITYQGGNLPYVFPSYNQITAFIDVDGTNLGAPTSSTQLYNWLKQYVFDVYAGGSGGGGGGTQDVNITQVNGVSPADLATETTLAFVPTYIGNPDNANAPDNYSKTGFALSNLFRGYWRDFVDYVGKNDDPQAGSPSGAWSLISLLKGFWSWVQSTFQFGSGTQAGALRVTLSTDGTFVNSTGNTTATQATTSIQANIETTADAPVVALLKLIAAKTKGQTGQRAVNATLNGADATMNLGGQTYKDFGLQMNANISSQTTAITVVISASATALTTGGNFEQIHTVTIPPGINQRTYEILLNRPVRTLRFNCTGGAGGTNTISITAACY